MKIEKVKLAIDGMTCDHCAMTVEKKLDTLEGIVKRKVSYAKKMGEIEFDAERLTKEDVIETINSTKHYIVKDEIRLNETKSEVNNNSIEDADKQYDFDLIIIGGGSSAFAAAIKASEFGKRSLIVNDGLPIGGTCVNVGCVPSKTLIRTAEAFYKSNHPVFEGIKPGDNKIEFKDVIAQKRELVESLREHKYIDVIKDDENITTLRGRGKIVNDNGVEIDGIIHTAANILIATGSSTFIPDIPGLNESGYYTNDTLYELDELPAHLVIIGGRYIALENAQMFARLGSKVTILQRSNRIIPNEEPELTETLKGFLEDEGITVKTGVKINSINKSGSKTILDIQANGQAESVEASHLLVATGRKGNTAALGLEELGIELHGNGFIKTDEFNRTKVNNIYAAGDVTGENLFVYTAAYAGALSVKNMFGEAKEKKDYSVLPWVIFTDPQVAGVGMNEDEAYRNGIDYDVATLWLKDVPRSLAARDTRGFIKLIRNKATDKLVGARILAPEGSELLMEISLAIKYGITVADIKSMFHPYLTLSEAVKLAAITFDKDVNKLSCCAV